MGSTVYFTREITPEKVLELYRMTGKELTGTACILLRRLQLWAADRESMNLWK